MYTFLHLSDLHRSSQEPVSNDTLLASLLSDRDRYALQATPNPDAAIITGDIIQGVRVGEENYSEVIRQQYTVAKDFLTRLADHFFDGDKSKIIIVPGNHDVCRNTAKESMIVVAPEQEPPRMGPHLFHSTNQLRWSWSDRRVYQIQDVAKYAQRMDAYWDFVEDFYQNVSLRFPINRDQGYNLFPLEGGRIIVVAFESVHGNDCFCQHGAIVDGIIGEVSLKLRDLRPQPLLYVAAWHHCLNGPPHTSDYMDIKSVHEMLGNGFRLGLHGHQHRSNTEAYKIHLPEQLTMAIVGAGSLCAGANELPRGVNRQYNVVVVNDDYASATVYLREMVEGSHFSASRRGVFNADGSTRIDWSIIPTALDAPQRIEKFISETIVYAEDLLREGDAINAYNLLSTVPKPPGAHARNLYIQASKALGEFSSVVELLSSPVSLVEFMELFSALLEEHQYEEAEALLSSELSFDIDSGLIIDLRSRVSIEKALRRTADGS